MAQGYLTLAFLGAFLLISEGVQRLLVAPLVTLVRPAREPVLAVWMRAMASGIVLILRYLCGTRIREPARIPGREGILLISNHQSLLDIPIAVRALTGKHPRIVTRARFARGIPVVSHLLRLTRAPLVDPGQPAAPQLLELGRVAATSEHPFVIYPEGHRSRDGQLLRWKQGGLRAILGARAWTVHLLVADGFHRAGRFRELARALPGLRGTAVTVGPFEWTDPTADPQAFLAELEARMAARFAALQAEGH